MSGPAVVVRESDELLRIAEKLAAGSLGETAGVVAALLVLGTDTMPESDQLFVDGSTSWSRLTKAIEAASPPSRDRSGGLQGQWSDWLETANRRELFAHERPFRDFPLGRLDEAARAVHRLFLRLPEREGRYLVGEIFDRFLSLLSERQGKRGDEFSTPRSVNELMVRLAELRLGMVVGDFYAGQGGTLIAALRQVGAPERGETPISGSEVNQASVFLARINLLLHDTDPGLIRHEDALSSWRPTDDEGRSFDRILSNPPFSLHYNEESYRTPPDFLGHTSGAKSELMMLQQMRASIRPGGRVIMAMPHGPLFRGGPEERIRRALLERGEIEAIVGIGPNLFQGTAIPSCLIVLRSPVQDPGESADVLLINAEREVEKGRNQNRLEPRHIEKITRVFQRRAEVPGFSRLVPYEEIAANAHNLNIRRYIEPSARHSPDLRAMVSGGVPPGEVEPVRERFAAFGRPPELLFEQRTDGYLFPRGEDGFAEVMERLSTLAAPVAGDLVEKLRGSWPDIVQRAHPPTTRPTLDLFRQKLVDGLCAELAEEGVLDEYELAGAFAQVWSERSYQIKDHFHEDRQVLVEHVRARFVTPLSEQLEELVRHRQRALVDTVRQWGERYGLPLTHLLKRSEQADRRFEERLQELGLDLG
ncbi:N-6 DNA methylase [Nocardiopsis sp. JB363]|uniref:N-6 DNA methylase n=1 Tax=Nocardiopsis sp. JB363 TaxID=1434837 RepID=UPI000B350B73|nr:N-6 DNA methylase [Nocardiopsis sp. JB363]